MVIDVQFLQIFAVDIDVFIAAAGRLTTNTSPWRPGARRIASATAWADSSAGMMPSVRDNVLRGFERLRIGDRHIFARDADRAARRAPGRPDA